MRNKCELEWVILQPLANNRNLMLVCNQQVIKSLNKNRIIIVHILESKMTLDLNPLLFLIFFIANGCWKRDELINEWLLICINIFWFTVIVLFLRSLNIKNINGEIFSLFSYLLSHSLLSNSCRRLILL